MLPKKDYRTKYAMVRLGWGEPVPDRREFYIMNFLVTFALIPPSRPSNGAALSSLLYTSPRYKCDIRGRYLPWAMYARIRRGWYFYVSV